MWLDEKLVSKTMFARSSPNSCLYTQQELRLDGTHFLKQSVFVIYLRAIPIILFSQSVSTFKLNLILNLFCHERFYDLRLFTEMGRGGTLASVAEEGEEGYFGAEGRISIVGDEAMLVNLVSTRL